jgi:hypothetical protein
MPKINKTYKKKKKIYKGGNKSIKKNTISSLVFDASKTHPASILPNYKPVTKYEIKPSSIHGNGLFATQDIQPREIIECAIKINGKNFTITHFFGVFINHSSKKDNIELIRMADGHYYAIATKLIPKNTEITANYDGPTIPPFIHGSKSHYV